MQNIPPPHTTPQAPQLLESVFVFTSQPSTMKALQSLKPALQVKPQVLDKHVGTLFGHAGHVTPQDPQLLTSLPMFVSQPSSGDPLQLS